MTKSELNKFRNVLEAKQSELVQLVRNRDGIAIEKSRARGRRQVSAGSLI